MATSNFRQREESAIFVVLENYISETDGTICSPEHWEIAALIDYVIDLLKEKFKQRYYVCDLTSNPNVPIDVICDITTSKMFGGINANIAISIYLDNGYYEAASLTFEVERSIDKYNSEMNEGMCKIQLRNAEKWMAKTEEKMRADIEAVFEQVSTPYRRVATFSNGESIYEPIRKAES